MKFDQFQSYAFIPVTFAIFVVIAMIADGLGFEPAVFVAVLLSILMPCLLAIIIAMQLRSGLALDTKWVAKYPRGTWQYKLLIAWNFFGLAAMVCIATAVLTDRFAN